MSCTRLFLQFNAEEKGKTRRPRRTARKVWYRTFTTHTGIDPMQVHTNKAKELLQMPSGRACAHFAYGVMTSDCVFSMASSEVRRFPFQGEGLTRWTFPSCSKRPARPPNGGTTTTRSRSLLTPSTSTPPP